MNKLNCVLQELSGLGQRDGHRRFFGERYKQLCDAVQTRTVFSVGITTFQLVKQKEPNTVMYRCKVVTLTKYSFNHSRFPVKVFDMLALEQRPFTVEPEALTFLSSHGFDFNRWLTYGIKYTKSVSSSWKFASIIALTIYHLIFRQQPIPMTLFSSHSGWKCEKFALNMSLLINFI